MRTAICLVTLALTAAGVLAQRPEAPAFEVASVRIASGPGLTSQRMTDTRVDFVLVRLRAVLLMAFRAKSYELVGPDWLAETLVTIQATLPPGATRQQVPEMLQRLLAERFGLVVHREPREMEVHELSVSSGGHKMREVEAANELEKTFAGITPKDEVQDTPDGPVRTVFTGDLGRNTITSRTNYKLTQNVDRLGRRTQSLDATRMTMAELAAVLTTTMGRPVLDRTTLPGTYQFSDVELPLDAALIERVDRSSRAFGFPGFEAPTASVPKALEPLGLRLERRRAPVDVIVIDKIERTPTDN